MRALVFSAMGPRDFNSNKLFTYPAGAGGYSSRRIPESFTDPEVTGLPWFGSMGNSFESDTRKLSCVAPILRANFLH